MRWRDRCITSALLSFSLVYCSSYSAKTLIDCLCSYTLVNLRSVSQTGLNCQDGRPNCITVQTRRPRSAPCVCATPRKEEKSTLALHSHSMCRLAGKRNPIFKIHWCHCTCCHSQWKHFELHDAAMSQTDRDVELMVSQTGMSKESRNELCLHFMGFLSLLPQWCLDCLSFCLIVYRVVKKQLMRRPGNKWLVFGVVLDPDFLTLQDLWTLH